MRSRVPFTLIFSLLLTLCVTVPGRAQTEGEEPEAADVSDGTTAETAAPESASPDEVPLTVFVRKYEKGTTRGGRGGGGSGRESEATALIWNDPVKNISLWNINYAMVENGAFTYGFGGVLPSGIMDDPEVPTGGFGLNVYATYYFSGTPFYGFFSEASLLYSMLESDDADLGGQVIGLSLGYMLEIGGPFVLEISAGADIQIDAPARKIWFLYNSDDGDVTFAGGLGLGITI